MVAVSRDLSTSACIALRVAAMAGTSASPRQRGCCGGSASQRNTCGSPNLPRAARLLLGRDGTQRLGGL
jgi:hypothetical protein